MQAIKNQPCLYKTKKAYYFRKNIPSHARNIIGMTECKKSFKKNNYINAKRKAAYLNKCLESLFIMIKNKQPDSKDIIDLIRIYFEKLLIDAEGDLWLDSEAWQEECFVDILKKHDGKTAEERIASLEEEYNSLKALSIRQGHKDHYRQLAIELLEWRGFKYFEMSPQSSQLRKGMMEAELEARRIELQMRKGNLHETDIKHPLLKNCRNFMVEADLNLLIENEGLPYYEQKNASPNLKVIVDRYINFREGNNYKGNTLAEISAVLNVMVKMFGEDRKISSITIEEYRNFRDLIQKYPAHYMKKYGNKGITVQEVVNSKKEYKQISPRSCEKYWQWIQSFFSWCVDETYLNDNLTKTLRVHSVKASSEDRDPFKNEELQQYFTSPQYKGHKSDSNRYTKGAELIEDGKYWIPLLALFTGMRLGEIIPLEVNDIKDDDGIFYIDINENNENKSLKNKQSSRKIPIHPELNRLGFLSYVEHMRSKSQQNVRIFQDIKIPKKGGISLNFSKYFSRYLKAIDLKRDKLVFHSFRHNFVQAMRDARIITERMDALDGRVTGYRGGSDTRRNYGRAFKPKDLYEDVKQIKYDIDLSHLYKD